MKGYVGKYIGVDMIDEATINYLIGKFNKKYIPVYLKYNPDKTSFFRSKCGMTWAVAKDMNIGDIILCPDGQGSYYIGR